MRALVARHRRAGLSLRHVVVEAGGFHRADHRQHRAGAEAVGEETEDADSQRRTQVTRVGASRAQAVAPHLHVTGLGFSEIEEDLRPFGVLLGAGEATIELDSIDLALVVLAVALHVGG